MEELVANPERAARGTVIEAHLDRKRGPVATLLVQAGTLRVGDIVTASATYGRVSVGCLRQTFERYWVGLSIGRQTKPQSKRPFVAISFLMLLAPLRYRANCYARHLECNPACTLSVLDVSRSCDLAG